MEISQEKLRVKLASQAPASQILSGDVGHLKSFKKLP